MTVNRTVIIGAGIGGLTAGALLAAQGKQVVILERSATPGGKMREVTIAGRQIDAGPTVLTMRWVFDEIFAAAGSQFDKHVTLHPLAILARHSWERGQELDLFADAERSAEAIGEFSGAAEARRFHGFCTEARHIYQTLKQPFMQSQRPGPLRLATRGGLGGLAAMLRINPFENMWDALGRHFTDPRLRQLFGRYATYCGSSPFEAVATLMLIAHVEQEGVWAVAGGMQNIAVGLANLAQCHGAEIHYGSEVSAIDVTSGRVSGVRTASGETFACCDVIVNADANAVATGLFGTIAARTVEKIPEHARSLSAVTWAAVARTSGFPLTRHNVFFSSDYAREFSELRSGFPSDPTVYICAQDRDGAVHGDERLLVLVNAPALGEQSTAAINTAMRRRLEASGLIVDWRDEDTVVASPAEFSRLFPATGGALYGGASHGWMASFRRPAASTALPGLYLAGGSVHPGPGVPMAALSGCLAAESLMASQGSTPWFRTAAIAGGTSML